MSSFSIGKNELKALLEKESEILEKLEKFDKNDGGVRSFQSILLQKEMEKVQNRLKVLGYMFPSNDENCPA